MSNIYEDAGLLEARVERGDHREVIGGLWEEMGVWQFEFCRNMGLRPEHQLLDIGCGSLRGGVHFVRYLDPDHYAGIDIHPSLLQAGYERELVPLGLADRLSKDRLIATTRFECAGFTYPFDMAIAQSVFTHTPWNQIRLCLEQIAGVMRPGARLFATYFEAGEDLPLSAHLERPHGITTGFDSNPYHYRFSDLEKAADGLPVSVRRLGDVGHPRGQFMAEFTFYGHPSASDTRSLPFDQALKLKAGADHYRAYVGPPRRFDFMSSTQFALLHSLGLREEDQVLDVGCGSLRLGRLLIPFLLEGGYSGIDPNAWLIEEGIRRELGMDAIRLKKPRFLYNSEFDFAGFDRSFDFIIAQSVATHTGEDLLHRLIAGAARALTPKGLFLFSYMRADNETRAPDGWHYPGCVEYSETDMMARLERTGLSGVAIPWFHPAASWIVAGRDRYALPGAEDIAALTGHVAVRPDDAKGYVYRP